LESATSLQTVYFVLFDEQAREVFERVGKKLQLL